MSSRLTRNLQRASDCERAGSAILIRFGKDGVSQGRYARFCKPMSWQFIDTQDGRWIVNCALDGPSGPSHWMAMPTHFDNAYLGAPLVALVVVESETPQLPEDHTWRQASMARAAGRQQADGSGQLWHTFADKDNQYPPF